MKRIIISWVGFALLLLTIMLIVNPSLFQQVLGKKSSIAKKQSDNKSSPTKEKELPQPLYKVSPDNNLQNNKIGTTSSENGKPALPQKPASPAWNDMLTLTFDVRYDEAIDEVIYDPQFTPALRALNGKIITLAGYIIPTDETQMMGQPFIILSAYPYSSCFFCGGAGPESVVQVFSKRKIEGSSKLVKIRGRLEFNETDFLSLPYWLREAELVP